MKDRSDDPSHTLIAVRDTTLVIVDNSPLDISVESLNYIGITLNQNKVTKECYLTR